jgi:hypothetical protein
MKVNNDHHEAPVDEIAARPPLFNLGIVVATPGARETISLEQIENLLRRHITGDWGEVDAEDAAQNEFALSRRLRLFSVYTVNSKRMWVITEADRSVTTVLLPTEY